MAVYATVIESQGWAGAPGFNTLYFEGAGEAAGVASEDNAAAALQLVTDFFTEIDANFSNEVTWFSQADVVARNPINGEGVAVFNVATGGVGSGQEIGDVLPPATTGLVNWRTATFGPRGRGRTFLPPTSEVNNNTLGAPSPDWSGPIGTGAGNLVAASNLSIAVNFVIWSRPQFDPDTGVQTRDGMTSVVTSASVSNTWAVLRSRRD